MKRIRIGNDVKVVWKVTENGEPMVFTGRDIRVQLLDPRSQLCKSDYVLGEGGEVIVEYSGKNQCLVGSYKLLLVSTDNDGRRLTIDAYAFELVPKSSMAGGCCDCGCLSVEIVELQGDTLSGVPGFSAYEIWLQNGHEGTEDDFLQWLWREGVYRREVSFDADKNIQRVYIEDMEHEGRKIYVQTDAESVKTHDSDTGLRSDLQTELNAISDKVNPLSVEVWGGDLYEEGTSQDVIVKWTVKRGGEEVKAKKTTVNGEVVDAIVRLFTGVTSTTDYNVVVEYGRQRVAKTVTARFIKAIRLGFTSSTAITATNIAGFPKAGLRTSVAGTYTVTSDAEGYMWICVPSELRVSRVTMNGFDVPMEAVTVLDGYNCYRCSNKLVAGSYTIVVS